MITLEAKLRASIIVDDNNCWVWQKARVDSGYGQVGVKEDGRYITRRAHRISYQVFRGPIPSGLQLDHLCRVRACINPSHLEPVTAQENFQRALPYRMRAMKAKKLAHPRTHCKNGHSWEAANIYRYPTSGVLACRPCKVQACLKSREKRPPVYVKIGYKRRVGVVRGP